MGVTAVAVEREGGALQLGRVGDLLQRLGRDIVGWHRRITAAGLDDDDVFAGVRARIFGLDVNHLLCVGEVVLVGKHGGDVPRVLSLSEFARFPVVVHDEAAAQEE